MLKPGLERSGGPGLTTKRVYRPVRPAHQRLAISLNAGLRTNDAAEESGESDALAGLESKKGTLPGPALALLAPARAITFGAFSPPYACAISWGAVLWLTKCSF